jgi:hypothetical protein
MPNRNTAVLIHLIKIFMNPFYPTRYGKAYRAAAPRLRSAWMRRRCSQRRMIMQLLQHARPLRF